MVGYARECRKTGHVDYVLSLEAIAQKILQIAAEDADTQN